MPFPPSIQKKYSERFQELIAEGNAIKCNTKAPPGCNVSDQYEAPFES